jgi:hypothetical protein
MAVHPDNTGDQLFSLRTRAINRHHRGHAGALQPQAGIALEAAVIPHTRSHRGFGQFEQHGAHSANEQRNWVCEHPPGNAILRRKRGFASGLAEVEREPGGRAHQILQRSQHERASFINNLSPLRKTA